jgi:3-hydroxyisobutyrate dehydrogenase
MGPALAPDPITRLGFIGLGRMGKPMTKNLLRAGFALTIHNRSQQAVDELVALGARKASSPRDLTRSADVLLTCLPGPHDVRNVLADLLPVARPGSVFVDLSTVDPETSRELAAAADARGVNFLDAPVSGGVSGAETGRLTVMVGGDREAFEQCRPILAALGERIYHLGPAGSGSLAKLCNQLLAGVGYAAVAEALVLGRKGGLNLRLLCELLSVSSGRSRALEQAAPRILNADYDASFTLDLACKDLDCVVKTGEQLGLTLSLASLARAIHHEAQQHDLGDRDQAAVVIPMADKAGIDVSAFPDAHAPSSGE